MQEMENNARPRQEVNSRDVSMFQPSQHGKHWPSIWVCSLISLAHFRPEIYMRLHIAFVRFSSLYWFRCRVYGYWINEHDWFVSMCICLMWRSIYRRFNNCCPVGCYIYNSSSCHVLKYENDGKDLIMVEYHREDWNKIIHWSQSTNSPNGVRAKAIKKLDGSTTTKFVQEIILCFGYPHNIITNNGSNFVQGLMAKFCKRKGIRLDLASVANPQTNGLVERANQMLLQGIKPWIQLLLERTPGCRIEELPSVVWGIRTSTNRSTGYTPFFMVYGPRQYFQLALSSTLPELFIMLKEENELNRLNGLDALDEERGRALSRLAIYHQGLQRYHNRWIVAPSAKWTWSCDWSSEQRVNTSSQLRGRDHLSSEKL
jgi:hypothetical protein